jgi:hypothetical protein
MISEAKIHILKQTPVGLISENCIGYHGTSLESVQYLLKNEVLGGEIYYFPVEHNREGPLMMARAAAESIAFRHYIASKLGLDLASPEDTELLFEPLDLPALASRAIRSLKLVQSVIQQAYFQKGIILGINSKVTMDFNIEDYNTHGDEGTKIVTHGQGINYGYILGLFPLGERESDFLQRLR